MNQSYFLLGDVNGSGDVTVADLAALAEYLIGSRSQIVFKATDVNGDGAITVGDLVGVANFLLTGKVGR